MQRASVFLSSILFYGLAFSIANAPVRAADWPKPITIPKSEAPAKIGAPNSGTLPSAINAPSSSIITPTISDTRQLLLPTLLYKMQSGELAPQQAWDDKLIDTDDLLWIFANKVDVWGGFYWDKNLPLRQELERLLAQNGGEKLQPMEKLPPSIRLWLADY